MYSFHSRPCAAGSAVRLARASLFGALIVWTGQAAAQGTGTTHGGDLSDADRAKRDAEKVFQWIRKAPAATPAAAPAAAIAPPATAKPAAKAARSSDLPDTPRETSAAAARPDTTRAPAAAPAGVALATPATAPAPAPASARTAALAPASGQVPVAAPPVSEPVVEPDEPLRQVVRADPEFSDRLMHQLRKGLVEVRFTVERDGSVTHPEMVSTTHPKLVEAALAAVAQWRFQPLNKAQQAVVSLGFDLQ